MKVMRSRRHRRGFDVAAAALTLRGGERPPCGAYDAFYVATERLYDASLFTSDGPLARAPTLGIVVQNIRGCAAGRPAAAGRRGIRWALIP